MEALRHKRLHRSLIVIALVGSVFAPCAAFAQSERVRSLMERYLIAAQKHDYPTLAKLTGEFRLEESDIKESNPRSFWSPLLAEFWKQKADDLEHNRVSHSSGEYVDLYGTREAAEITSKVVNLMTPSAKWHVEEIRPRPRRPFSPIYYLDVYVAVSYMSIDKAPRVGDRALKKLILTCVLDGPDLAWVRGCSRVEQGDVFWPKAP